MKAPFTEKEIFEFNVYQDQLGIYTCMGNEGKCERGPENNFGTLKATKECLICPCGKYKQLKTL